MRLLRENLRQQAPTYAVAMVAMVVIAITSSLTAWMMSDIIDSMMSTGNKSEVYAVAVAIAAIFIVKGLASYVQLVFMGRAGNSIVANLQKQLFERILQHGVSFFSESGGSSDLLMRVTNSANGARQVINTIVTGFVRDALTLIGLVCVMFYQQPLLSFICLITGPIALYGVRRILAHVQQIVAAQMGGLSTIIKTVQETSSGIRVVKAFDLEGTMKRRMNKAVKEVQELGNSIIRLEAATSPLMETLGGLAIAGVIALSTVEIFGQTDNSAGRLMSFITAVLMAYEPAKRLAKMRVNIEVGMVMASMMYQVLDMPIALTQKEDAEPLPEGLGRIKLENVGFSYASGTAIIKDLNLDIEPGKTTAFVGPSGGGKSTIINLILRLYDPTSGTIYVDGMDLKDASFSSIRNKISFVGQDTFLFSGTVRENIEMGRQGASEEEIIAAAKAANAHEFIENLDGGYYSDVGENGGRLSGGQRQRISIARALLRDSPILLMDEATSALDATTEYEVQEALENLSVGRTTIVIAHRLSTILNADRIIVIKEGAIVEDGKMKQLLDQKGPFRMLYDHQLSASKEG